MSTVDDIAWGDPEPEQVQLAKPRKCRRHRWVIADDPNTQWPHPERPIQCANCGAVHDTAASRRGRTNRSRGNAIERDVAKALGLKRTGQFGGPDDASGELFVVQVKSGKSFPERIYRWLKAVPTNAVQTPLVVVTDAPGPGHRRRALVVLTLEDWVALHGTVNEEAA